MERAIGNQAAECPGDSIAAGEYGNPKCEIEARIEERQVRHDGRIETGLKHADEEPANN